MLFSKVLVDVVQALARTLLLGTSRLEALVAGGASRWRQLEFATYFLQPEVELLSLRMLCRRGLQRLQLKALNSCTLQHLQVPLLPQPNEGSGRFIRRGQGQLGEPPL